MALQMFSPILGGVVASPTAGATTYMFPAGCGAEAWDNTESNVAVVVPCAFEATEVCFDVRNGPGSTRTLTLTVMKNGVATSLTGNIVGSATTVRCAGQQVSFAAGDTISIQAIQAASATNASRVSWAIVAYMEGQPVIASGTTITNNFTVPAQGRFDNQNMGNKGQPIATPGVASGFKLRVPNPGSGKTVTFTLVKGAESDASLTATSVVIAITGDGGGGFKTGTYSGSISISAGDRIGWKQTLGGGAASSSWQAGFTFVPTSNGHSFVAAAFGTQAMSNSYASPLGNAAWNATEAARQQVLPACTVSKLYLQIASALGGGDSYAIVLRKNASSSGCLTATLTSAALYASDLVTTQTVTALDLFSLLNTPGGSASGGILAAGFDVYMDPGAQQQTLYAQTTCDAYTNNLADDAYWGPAAFGYVCDDNTTASQPGATTYTARNWHVSSYNCHHLRAWAQIKKHGTPGSSPTSYGEAAIANTVTGQLALQKNVTAGPNTQTGVICPSTNYVTWPSTGQTYSGTYSTFTSNPLFFPVRQGEIFFGRPGLTVSLLTDEIPGSYRTRGNTGQENDGSGSGYSASNLVDSGTVDLSQSFPNTYGTSFFEGYFPDGTIPRSLAVIGDSMIRTGGGSVLGVGADGFLARIALGQYGAALNLSDLNDTIPFSDFSQGGEWAIQYINSHTLRLAMSKRFTTVLCEYGRHDVSDLAATKTRLVTIYGYYSAETRVRRYIQTTLTPDDDITMDASGNWVHSLGSKAANIAALNTWLLDGSFHAAITLAGFDASKVLVWDMYSVVGDANGYWREPTGAYQTAVVTTTDTAATTLRFDTTSWSVSQPAAQADQGLVGVFTSGALTGHIFGIRYSKTTGGNGYHQIIPLSTLSSIPQAGDTLRLYNAINGGPVWFENPHMSNCGHAICAEAFPGEWII